MGFLSHCSDLDWYELLNINLKAEVTRKLTAGLKSEMLEIKDKLMDIQQNIGKFKAHEGEDE